MKKVLLFITLISFIITQSQIVNIPNTNFKNTLLSSSSTNYIAKDLDGNRTAIDTNGDNEIQNSEAENISYLSMNYKSITDLIGIEAFTNLTYLSCYGNQLSDLNLTQNTNLTELQCHTNQLNNLNLTQNTNLTILYCHTNQLSNLDVSQNTNLVQLYGGHNQLTSLDISHNINLTHLSSYDNLLSNLNISHNLSLIMLSCSKNQLNNLDISQNTNLISFGCSDNQLTNIDISANTELISLSCNENQISNLDTSTNTKLHYLYCSDNQLTNIDVFANTELIKLTCNNNQLTNLGLSTNTELIEIECYNNQLTSLDVSQNTNLDLLYCNDNQLTSLDVSQNTDLHFLNNGNNQLNYLDISQNHSLSKLYCYGNQLSSLDVSQNTILRFLNCRNNLNLFNINLKNGYNDFFRIDVYSDFENLPNLQNVCVDELDTDLTAFISTEVGHSITFNTDCSIISTEGNIINGNTSFDLDLNGCDTNDITLSKILITSNNNTESFATFTQNNGSYLLYVNEGDFSTEVTTNLPNYFTVNPSSVSNTFTDFDNTFTADFCIEPNQTINDVNISIIPISQTRPGFDTAYQIIYKNVGTTQLNGSVILEFDETKLSFLNASETINSQSSNSLTFNYSNLNPFETKTINLEFNVFTPPTVNIDDILSFTATINPIASDLTADDNVFTLNQTVIGSYDPNDITCLEGNQVLYADKDEYLHYIVRFQNTGTASTINVVVKNILDANLDWSTLQLESISHNNRVSIKNRNEIEFIFENINLPDSTTDEPNSQGYIAYKIKPKSDIALDDVILNKVDIFFDYNQPIETNTANTRIVSVLAVNESRLLDFSVYPTPTENILNIKSKNEISEIKIYSKLGQLIIKNTTDNKINVSNLTQGIYFVKVKDMNGNIGVKKIMKK